MVTLESVTGLLGFTIMTGMLFARVARGTDAAAVARRFDGLFPEIPRPPSITSPDLPVEIDFMAISALGASGPVRIVKDLDVDIQGRHVVLVEDIVDTGMTLRYILGHLERWRPASLEVCALFDKRARRLADVPIRYVGFELADEFVVGYGLDYHQRYRNLPFLAKLRPERYRPDPSA